MLFNSYVFVFGFLPTTLFLFFVIGHFSIRLAAAWLMLMSFVFYGWVQPSLVPLLLGSVIFNFATGIVIQRQKRRSEQTARVALIVGVCANLLLLAYFKYTGFLITNLSTIAGTVLPDFNIALPLGISFFTFTQIAYLVDCRTKQVGEYDVIHYLLFVSYFPHLIAGPIIHHAELMPQFATPAIYRINLQNVAVGMTAFLIGLFKKVVVADGIAGFANPVFDAASAGPVSFSDGWLGAFSYSFQIYFDFSGYSDMALGISAMFGIFLPVNFWSPYKSASIIEFWSRWHITLSRFLREYVYFRLGGNRTGRVRRYVNLLATMMIGGFWHGASWSFILWGLLHGIYLIVNHAWRSFRVRHAFARSGNWITFLCSVLMTYIAVVFSWVLFRAADLNTAFEIIRAMLGLNSIGWPISHMDFLDRMETIGRDLHQWAVHNAMPGTDSNWPPLPWLWILTLSAFVFLMPNTIELMRRYRLSLTATPANERRALSVVWDLTWPWVAFDAAIASACILSLSNETQFLYYRF